MPFLSGFSVWESSLAWGARDAWPLYVFLAAAVFMLVGWVRELLGSRIKNIKGVKARLESEYQERVAALEDDRHALDMLFREKSLGFPWLATAYADYFKLQELRVADSLDAKARPAPKAAEAVRDSIHRRFVAEKLWRILKYKLEYYETLFPWLVDFEGEELDQLIKQVLEGAHGPRAEGIDDFDPASQWLTQAEFEHLSSAQRNQLALDRYQSAHKSKWQVGRDYERYIGYVFANQGWDVQFYGIVEGFADLGRDLIATKDGRALIVQCKCWSAEKEIHEKHVFQLFGTLEDYKLKQGTAEGWLVTSTRLSARAEQFAERLGIHYWENVPLANYPSIKCNVSYRDRTKIYHLPFDQQYDRTTIDEERCERYVATVAEAEALGFRRAWRWRGPTTGAANLQQQTTPTGCGK